jgi:hypothetical protein
MKDQKISSEGDLEDKLTELGESVSGAFLESVFSERKFRSEWVMEHEGEYYMNFR